MKTKQIEIEGLDNPVTIWKMNFGFQQDFSEEVTEMTDTETRYLSGKANIYTLVYGIWKAPSLSIQEPDSLQRGLTDQEKRARVSQIRSMDVDIAQRIKEEIAELNKVNQEVKGEIAKK